MILIRNVFQAKYGQGDGLVTVLKDGREFFRGKGMGEYRILTDLAGPFFTVVMEMQAESLAEYEAQREAMSDPEFGQWFSRMMEFVESGRRELFTIEE